DPSDVFSLGCVFLEMATLILGRDLQRFCDHYTTRVNDSGVEDAYHQNLDRVYSWVEYLQKSRDSEQRGSSHDLSLERIEGQDFMPDKNLGMIESLSTIRLMLDIDTTVRPVAKHLWLAFKNVSVQICRDCDPRLPHENWTPDKKQKDASEIGTSRRRSMKLIPEEASDNPSMESRDDQPTDAKLLNTNYHSDRSRPVDRRASSPNVGRYLSPRSMHSSPPSVLGNDPSASAEGDVRMRRTTSATDGRRGASADRISASRSMSPAQRRRPYSESRLQSRNPVGHALTSPGPTASHNGTDRSSDSPAVRGSEHDSATADAPVQQFSDTVQGPPSAPDNRSNSERSHVRQQSHSNGHVGAPISANTPVIIYDLAQRLPYVSAFAQLIEKRYGEDYISQQLPRFGEVIDIVLEERTSPIATVDLSTLGAWNRTKRWRGHFPTLYVLNFSIQPLG
ncbi:MAG: hypothetical protein Q9183_005464, partial [Haloplaca sp. 2 TL-2023]